MSYEVKNTADDRSKAYLHRTAPKLVMEPVIMDRRLKLRESMTIPDGFYEIHKDHLLGLQSKGVIEIKKLGGDPAPVAKETVPVSTNQGPGAGVSATDDTPPATQIPQEESVRSESLSSMDTPIRRGPGKKKLF